MSNATSQPKPSFHRSIVIAIFVALGLLCESSHAQMFGPRTVGKPLTRQQGPGLDATGAEAGALTGGERFLRSNRKATDFVGVDRAEANTFVGAGQIIQSGRVQSAIESLQNPPDRSQQMNQVWAAAPVRAPYAPRLELKFESGDPSRFWLPVPHKVNSFDWSIGQDSSVSTYSGTIRNPFTNQQDLDVGATSSNRAASTPALDFEQLNPDLTRRVHRTGVETLQVFVIGRTAILRGTVSNPHQRELAELLLGFEPGIAKVQNEIAVERP